MNGFDHEWHQISNVLDANTRNWRELALVVGLTPTQLETAIPALKEPKMQAEARHHLGVYKREIERLVEQLGDLNPFQLFIMKKTVVEKLWELPVQHQKRLPKTVEEIVRQEGSPPPVVRPPLVPA